MGLDSGPPEKPRAQDRESEKKVWTEPSMWGYLSVLPAFLAFSAITGVWSVFALAVTNRSVNLTEGFPYISLCGSYPPQSCIFSQLLNMGAAMGVQARLAGPLPSPPSRLDLHYPLPPAPGLGSQKMV